MVTSVAGHPVPWSADSQPLARYDCEIRHGRHTPVQHGFRYRSPLWLIDVDQVPALPRWLSFVNRFDVVDHWRPGTLSLRAGLDEFLAGSGAPRPARVLLLTGARSFGQCFNPLSVYWCYDADGRHTQVVAEVHNTYRGRHAYLLQLDDAGRDTVDKQFYVSPFFAAEGRYRMRISAPVEKIDVMIALELAGRVPFTATMHGARTWLSRWGLLSRPLAQLRVAALIRWEGIRLWRRGVAVQPRSGSADIETATAGNLAGPLEQLERR